MTPAEEAVGIAIEVHDAAMYLARESGVPMFEHPARGFIAALEAQDPPFTVVPLAEATQTADRPSLREAAVALEKVAVAPDALMNDNDPAGRELRSWWLERFGPALAALRQALEGSDADLRSEDEG